MKETVASILLAIAAVTTAQADSPVDNFTLVTNLWWNGHKTEVLQIAEQRLAANSNDLAGLFLKLEYAAAFSDVTSISNSIGILSGLLHYASTTNFLHHVPILQMDFSEFRRLLESGQGPSPEDICADEIKGSRANVHFTYEPALKALHDDGLF